MKNKRQLLKGIERTRERYVKLKYRILRVRNRILKARRKRPIKRSVLKQNDSKKVQMKFESLCAMLN